MGCRMRSSGRARKSTLPQESSSNESRYSKAFSRITGGSRTLFCSRLVNLSCRKLTSGLWDLAGWVREDALAAAPVINSVQAERLEHWLHRAEKFVDLVTEMFPEAFTVWRSLHYCIVY